MNETLGIASTYACYNECMDSFDFGWVDPSGASIWQGQSVLLTAYQQDKNHYGGSLPPYPVLSAMWSSNASYVASVSPLGEAYGVSGGGAVIEATWLVMKPSESEACHYYQDLALETASISVTPATVQVDEVGFTGDHTITKWPPTTPLNVIDDPDGSAPTWKRTGNPDHPVAYTKGANITMFAELSVSPSLPNSEAMIRVKDGSTVIATKAFTLSGSSATVTGISTMAPLENTVKSTTPTFTWDISFNGGSSWSSIGTSGPHTLYRTYDAPLSPPFKNDDDDEFPPLYDLALDKATCYSNGASTVGEIISKINGLPTDGPPQGNSCGTSVQGDIYYDPAISIGTLHPLQAYAVPNGIQCSDNAFLLRGLLRSIGIDGTVRYIWAGPNASTIYLYQVGSNGRIVSFRIDRSAHEGSTETDPHFSFHAVVAANGTWYDPSFGGSYSTLPFTETLNSSSIQQVHDAPWGFMNVPPYSSCIH